MRQEGDSEVVVGRHLPPSSGRVAAFMDHFDKRFQIAARSASGRIIAIASAHHRPNYIHPFLDGNGRVSRLMSHAMALEAGIGGQGFSHHAAA
jgi:Fic family protein